MEADVPFFSLQKLSEKVEEQEFDGFTKVVEDYESISRLDPWHTKLLLRVKQSISAEDDLK